MKKIFFGTRNMIVPGHWNELKKEDLLYFSKLMSANYTRQEIIVALTAYFAKMKVSELERYNPLIFHEIEHQFDFLFKEVKLRKQLIPEIRLGLVKYKGAKEGLADFTFERFLIFAETYFESFLRTGDEKWLNMLIATLYTLDDWKAENIERDAKRLSKLSQAYKTAIFYFYVGNRNYIATRFPLLFKKKKTKKGDTELHFIEVIETLNGGDISKNNEIKNVNIYEVFARLTNMVKEMQKQK